MTRYVTTKQIICIHYFLFEKDSIAFSIEKSVTKRANEAYVTTLLVIFFYLDKKKTFLKIWLFENVELNFYFKGIYQIYFSISIKI